MSDTIQNPYLPNPYDRPPATTGRALLLAEHLPRVEARPVGMPSLLDSTDTTRLLHGGWSKLEAAMVARGPKTKESALDAAWDLFGAASTGESQRSRYAAGLVKACWPSLETRVNRDPYDLTMFMQLISGLGGLAVNLARQATEEATRTLYETLFHAACAYTLDPRLLAFPLSGREKQSGVAYNAYGIHKNRKILIRVMAQHKAGSQSPRNVITVLMRPIITKAVLKVLGPAALDLQGEPAHTRGAKERIALPQGVMEGLLMYVSTLFNEVTGHQPLSQADGLLLAEITANTVGPIRSFINAE